MPSRPGRARSLAFLLVLFLFAFFAIAANATSCPSASTTTCFVNLDGAATSHGSGSSTTFSLTNSALTQIGNETGSGLGLPPAGQATTTSG
jgi:ABC-type phosphate transport system substrate-binding protein